MAVLSKLQDNEAVIVDDLGLSQIRTKDVAAVLHALKLKGTSCLIGTAGPDTTIFKSARNIPGVHVLPTAQFNAYAVLRPKRLLLTRAALDELRKDKSGQAAQS
jgi:large subunit ribosomal protein L4